MEEKERCSFAIISHPDAGKTTMTEKLLWYGDVIRNTGMVKSKNKNYAKSDWMELEKQRGISVTSAVISFNYRDRAMHLLDTPGHKDFSEDTYRTLTAVESVLMMIDSAKGVEAQTIKLMEVCRLRDTPIVTFMNKFDRDSLDPFELLEIVEKILSIQCVPMTWPIGNGADFKGVYDIALKEIRSLHSNDDYSVIIDAQDLTATAVIDFLGEEAAEKLRSDLELVEELIPSLDMPEFLAGIQTPVFFGSALNNFGVAETLEFIAKHCPAPVARQALLSPFSSKGQTRLVHPQEEKFSGVIFKIQANMDKRHRDRIAFMRVCSGKFVRNQKIFHVRTGKDIKIPAPLFFQAQDRRLIEYAYPGDIIGLHDTGRFQIGDTFTEGELLKFTGIPHFAPEIFMKVLLKDPLKSKQLDKGLQQLSEEGTVQLFYRHNSNEKILGAVGMLQFDVVKFRLEDEYKVRGDYTPFPFIGIRWLQFVDDEQQELFIQTNSFNIAFDNKKRVCFGVRSDWDLNLVREKNPTVEFFANSDFMH